MNSKNLAVGLITTWLFVMLSGAAHVGAKPVSPAGIDETNLEFRTYV